MEAARRTPQGRVVWHRSRSHSEQVLIFVDAKLEYNLSSLLPTTVRSLSVFFLVEIEMLLALKLLCVTAVAITFQGVHAKTVLNVQDSSQYDGYAPGHRIMHLSNIESHDFTTLSHPRFPNHQVRLKKSHFCDPTVKCVIPVPLYYEVMIITITTASSPVISMSTLELSIYSSTFLKVDVTLPKVCTYKHRMQ